MFEVFPQLAADVSTLAFADDFIFSDSLLAPSFHDPRRWCGALHVLVRMWDVVKQTASPLAAAAAFFFSFVDMRITFETNRYFDSFCRNFECLYEHCV